MHANERFALIVFRTVIKTGERGLTFANHILSQSKRHRSCVPSCTFPVDNTRLVTHLHTHTHGRTSDYSHVESRLSSGLNPRTLPFADPAP